MVAKERMPSHPMYDFFAPSRVFRRDLREANRRPLSRTSEALQQEENTRMEQRRLMGVCTYDHRLLRRQQGSSGAFFQVWGHTRVRGRGIIIRLDTSRKNQLSMFLKARGIQSMGSSLILKGKSENKVGISSRKDGAHRNDLRLTFHPSRTILIFSFYLTRDF